MLELISTQRPQYIAARNRLKEHLFRCEELWTEYHRGTLAIQGCDARKEAAASEHQQAALPLQEELRCLIDRQAEFKARGEIPPPHLEGQRSTLREKINELNRELAGKIRAIDDDAAALVNEQAEFRKTIGNNNPDVIRGNLWNASDPELLLDFDAAETMIGALSVTLPGLAGRVMQLEKNLSGLTQKHYPHEREIVEKQLERTRGLKRRVEASIGTLRNQQREIERRIATD